MQQLMQLKLPWLTVATHAAADALRGMYAKGDPATSKLAAERVVASGARRRQVETVALELGRAQRRFGGRHGKNKMGSGLTSAELAVEAGLDRAMIARRLPDAARQGLIERARPRQCRVNGGLAVTWRAK